MTDEVRVRRSVPLPLPIPSALPVRLVSFDGAGIGDDVALVFGETLDAAPWVRVHSACLTGDLFGSRRCDCGEQLRMAIGHLALHGGVLLYLNQEGRGIGLKAKIDAYALQDAGVDTFDANRALGHEADARSYIGAAGMLKALGLRRIRLLSGNPDKRLQLATHGVDVVDVVPLDVPANPHNAAYLASKKRFFDALSAAAEKDRPPGRE